MSTERRTVVVTGANRGIGYELARQLTARGELVVLTARTLAKARRATDSLPPGAKILPVGLDVTSERDAAALEQALREHTDRVDVLINNAAIHYDSGQHAIDADLQVVREALETNVIGVSPATRRSRGRPARSLTSTTSHRSSATRRTAPPPTSSGTYELHGTPRST